MKATDIVEEIVEDGTQEVEGEQEHTPVQADWVEFVLDKLADHELVNGAPTTDGLRRVTELVFGEILESETDIIHADSRYAVAKHTLVIRKHAGCRCIIKVSAAVDVQADKLPHPFCNHVVSTACTRAEGKALRRALKIRVQTAEELSNDDASEVETKESINDQQIAAIKTLCKRNNVDVMKFAKTITKAKNIKGASNLEGRLLLTKLSEFQREGVPEELQGYQENFGS